MTPPQNLFPLSHCFTLLFPILSFFSVCLRGCPFCCFFSRLPSPRQLSLHNLLIFSVCTSSSFSITYTSPLFSSCHPQQLTDQTLPVGDTSPTRPTPTWARSLVHVGARARAKARVEIVGVGGLYQGQQDGPSHHNHSLPAVPSVPILLPLLKRFCPPRVGATRHAYQLSQGWSESTGSGGRRLVNSPEAAKCSRQLTQTDTEVHR